MKKPRITVRSTARDGGRGIGAPRTFKVMRDGENIATIQESSRHLATWFWYGLGVNTANRPDAFDAVKAEAMAHCRQHFDGAPAMVGDQSQ